MYAEITEIIFLKLIDGGIIIRIRITILIIYLYAE